MSVHLSLVICVMKLYAPCVACVIGGRLELLALTPCTDSLLLNEDKDAPLYLHFKAQAR